MFAIISADQASESFCSLCLFLVISLLLVKIWTAAWPAQCFKPPCLCLPSSMVSSVITSSSEEPSLGSQSDAFRTSPKFLGIFKEAHRRVFFFFSSSALTFLCYQPPELVACVGRRAVNGPGMWCSTHLTLSLISAHKAAVLLCLVESFSIAIRSFFLLLKLLFTIYSAHSPPRGTHPSVTTALHFPCNPFCPPCTRKPRTGYSSLLQGHSGSVLPHLSFGKSLLRVNESNGYVLQRMLMGRGTGGVGSSALQPKITPMCTP